MTLDTRQLKTIIGRFRTQHALEVGTRGLFYGAMGAASIILWDKIAPFPTTVEPGWYALGAGVLVGGLAGGLALLKRFKIEEAARAVDAHYELHELLGSAQELSQVPGGEFETALTDTADSLVRSENFTRDFRLRAPRYSRQAGVSMIAAGMLVFLPPLASLSPTKRAEMADIKARESALKELSRDLKEIRKDDKELEELAKEVDDLAIRAAKNRVNKEDFLRELDDIQKQLENRMADLNKEGAAKALEALKESMSELKIPEVAEAKDLAAQMASLQNLLEKKALSHDQLDALEKKLKDQQECLAKVPELKNLSKELGKMREEALKQQDKKLDGEVGRLLEEMKKEAESGAKKTPESMKQELQSQVEQMKKEAQQDQLGQEDTQQMQSKIDQQKPQDPNSASKMEELNKKLEQALMKKESVAGACKAQQESNEQQKQPGKEGQQGKPDSQKGDGDQGKDKGNQSQSGESNGEKEQGAGQKGQQGKSGSQNPSDNPTGGGQGQMSVEEWMKQQGEGAQGQSGQPMEGAPDMGPGGAGEGQSGSGSGSSSGFSEMSKAEMQDWAKMLEEYQSLDSSSKQASQCRGGKPGQGGGIGGNGWGLGHNPEGAPSNTGSGQAPDEPGMKTEQSKLSLEQLGDFQALYDPHFADAKIKNDIKVSGEMREGESGGFTMVKAPNVEEGDAITPYFEVDPATLEAEVQALENQQVPANLEELVREYFESLNQ